MNAHHQSTSNSACRSGLLAILTSCVVVSMVALNAAPAMAQSRESTDIDHPVRVTSNEITAPIGNREIFYTFAAGPGELTMTLDLMQQDVGATVEIILMDKEAKKIFSFYGWALGHTDRKVERVSFIRRQQVLLKINIYNAGQPYRGTFRLRFAGPIELPQPATEPASGIASNGGTMRILMKDSSTQDIDLSRVQRITILP